MLSGIFSAVTNQTIGETRAERQARNYEELRDNFRNIFDNSLHLDSQSFDLEGLVDTVRTLEASEAERFDFNLHIPRINIDHANIDALNEVIRNTYLGRAEQIYETSTSHTIFNVDYVAYVNGNVLSLIVRASLRYGNNPQRLLIQAVNVNLDTNTVMEIDDVIALKELDRSEMQERINSEITERIRQVEALAEATEHNIFMRDLNDPMYLVENVNNFFLGEDGHLFIMFAYGNRNYTNEIDVVIF